MASRHSWRWVCPHYTLEWKNTLNITHNQAEETHPCQWEVEAYDGWYRTVQDWTPLLNGSWITNP